MTSDRNKNITSILYNHLDMPTQITVSGSGSNDGVIDYVYAADRTKLQKRKTQAGVTTTTDYCKDYVYENGTLKQITQPEGYIEPDGSSWQYVYRYTDIWGNTRLTYADDDGNGVIDPQTEIRREQNYYPFGMEHQGYNSNLRGVKNDLKTYQSQEFTEDLGLNVHEWRFRVSDPSIGRFWQIDPLADEYVYNSTYAFQENKLGMGIELEGAELLKRFKDGMNQLKKGMSDMFQNETGKELNRRMESGKTQSAEKKEQIQQQKLADQSNALGEIADGTSEATKGGAQIVGTSLEGTGDAIIAAGVVTGQPEIVVAGEILSNTGTAINTVVDLSDGKSIEDVAVEQVPKVVLGQLGKKIQKSISNSKNLNETDKKVLTKTAKLQEMVIEKITTSQDFKEQIKLKTQAEEK